jgi:tripartite-type tricarboxylate transporter receptor subunit TctC
MSITRILAALAVLAIASSAAQAQQWPNRPIQAIVPFAAGGSTDVAARLVGQHLARVLGQQVVVENKAGANGNLGIELASKAAPDGHTLLIVPETITSNPHVYKVGYDLKDFMPVAQISRQPIVLAAHPTLGAKLRWRRKSPACVTGRAAARDRSSTW